MFLLQSSESRTLQSELAVIDGIMRNINNVLVHGSPVVVIQRWLRGHISRRKHSISYAQVRYFSIMNFQDSACKLKP